MVVLECLRANPILTLLPDDELAKLSKRAVTRHWKKNQVLFRKDDASDGLHGVMSGCIVTAIEGAAMTDLNSLQPTGLADKSGCLA